MDSLLPPAQVNIVHKHPVAGHQHHQQVPVQVQRHHVPAQSQVQVGGGGGGSLQGRTKTDNIDYAAMRAVADLESDIGEVVDGLTELADRFPEDFNSLMKTFHEQNAEPHITPTREISPMDILNLANIITQVHEEVKCVKPAKPPHGRILCNSVDVIEGTKCLLECDYGYVSEAGELTVCQAGNTWSLAESRLRCVRPLALLVGGYNAEEGLLSHVEIFSPSGKCGGVKVAPLPVGR